MIYSSMVKSVRIYEAETWSLYEDYRRRIDTNEMEVLRRSAGISKLDRKTNEYFLTLVFFTSCTCFVLRVLCLLLLAVLCVLL